MSFVLSIMHSPLVKRMVEYVKMEWYGNDRDDINFALRDKLLAEITKLEAEK
jgi:hypothetical protein